MEFTNLLQEKTYRLLSENADETLANIQQTGLHIESQEQLSQFLDKKIDLDHNQKKEYSLIYTNCCMHPMQSRLDSHPDFELKIKNSPIYLLKVI